MGRALLVLISDADRQKAISWIRQAPNQTRVEFKASKRSLAQNDKLWACLTEISEQVDWYGQRLSPDDWKDVFTAALRKARVVPGIDQGTFVPLGMRTSDLSKEEFSDLLELMHAFAAERGVVFRTDMMGDNHPQEPQDAHSAPSGYETTSDTETLATGLSRDQEHQSDAAAPNTASETQAESPPAGVEGDGQSSLSGSSPSPIQECAVKILGIAVDPLFDTAQQRRGALEKAKDVWKGELPEEDHTALRALVQSADAIIKDEADYEAAVSHFSEMLEIPVEKFVKKDG